MSGQPGFGTSSEQRKLCNDNQVRLRACLLKGLKSCNVDRRRSTFWHARLSHTVLRGLPIFLSVLPVRIATQVLSESANSRSRAACRPPGTCPCTTASVQVVYVVVAAVPVSSPAAGRSSAYVCCAIALPAPACSSACCRPPCCGMPPACPACCPARPLPTCAKNPLQD